LDDGFREKFDNSYCDYEPCCDWNPCFKRGFFVENNKIYIANTKKIFKSENSGKSYEKIFPMPSYYFTGYYHFSSKDLVINQFQVKENNIYIASNNGLFISNNSGASFYRKTTEDGLGHNIINSIDVAGDTILAATEAGLSISNDGGTNFSNKTTNEGLIENVVLKISADGNTIAIITEQGLSVSTDNGNTFTLNKTEDFNPDFDYGDWDPNSGKILYTYVKENNIFVRLRFNEMVKPTLYFSEDNGNSFTKKAKDYGLNKTIHNIFVSNNSFYLASYNGLFISVDGGNTFSRYNEKNGLGCEYISAVTVYEDVIYALVEGYTRNFHPEHDFEEMRRFVSISYDGGKFFTNKEIKL
jgi:hypothetical protein